ncbi:MAG TPA: hypothetical protein VGA00_08840 [Acidiferrobacterales bacterium]
MNKARTLRTTLLQGLLILACLFASPARADVLDDFAWLLDQLGTVNANPLPVTGSDIKSSKGLFTCLDGASNDPQVIGCIDKFKDTPLGKKATGAAGIPSWFWDLIDLYVAFRTDDYWGIVSNVGEAGVCIVAQVMAAGAVDICGLIQELVELAKDVLDAGKAIAKFFASLGEGAWEAAKDVGCALGLGGCGSSSPPEQIAYAWVFAPKIADGLAARKSTDPSAFSALRQLLESNALATPAKLSMPVNIPVYLDKKAVDIASKIYVGVVDAQWTADIAKNVLPALAKKRGEYDSAQQIAIVAKAAAAGVTPGSPDPTQLVVKRCTDDFRTTYGFAHVDRWILQFPAEAQKLGGVKSNNAWCAATFWAKNKGKFAPHFVSYVKSNLCPAYGSQLLCPTLAKYQSCLGLLGSVGQQAQCAADSTAAGMEAAQKIKAYFKQWGSKIPCTIVAPGNPTQPVDYRCPRPPQQHSCNKAYDLYYGKLPQKLVNCSVQIDPQYAALKSQVAQAVGQLSAKHKVSLGVDSIDPLLVHFQPPLLAALHEDLKDQGFGAPSTKPGFDFLLQVPRPVDGVDTPAFVTEIKVNVPKLAPKENIKDKVVLVQPGDPDPTQKFSIGGNVLNAPAGAAQQPGGTGLKPGVAPALSAKSPALGGVPTGPAAGAPTKPLSGGLPPGFGTPGAKPGSGPVGLAPALGVPPPRLGVVGVRAKIEPNCQAPQPALTAMVTIKNTGGPLSAGKGSVSLKEIGGANLSSAGIHLPAIGAGQTRTVSVAALTLNPYSTLAGTHQIQVFLTPQIAAGQTSFVKPATPYQFTVSFPAGHCGGSPQRAPGTATGLPRAPGELTGAEPSARAAIVASNSATGALKAMRPPDGPTVGIKPSVLLLSPAPDRTRAHCW